MGPPGMHQDSRYQDDLRAVQHETNNSYWTHKYKHTKTDVCIVDRSQNDILLLVQEDKSVEDREPANAQAQLVAGAIAAFEENNSNRIAAGLEPLEEKVSYSHFCLDYS